VGRVRLVCPQCDVAESQCVHSGPFRSHWRGTGRRNPLKRKDQKLGMWLREAGVGGSNPLTPTNNLLNHKDKKARPRRAFCFLDLLRSPLRSIQQRFPLQPGRCQSVLYNSRRSQQEYMGYILAQPVKPLMLNYLRLKQQHPWRQSRMELHSGDTSTTEISYINRDDQQHFGHRAKPGTDHGQRAYK
jgi:hypothetical protein